MEHAPLRQICNQKVVSQSVSPFRFGSVRFGSVQLIIIIIIIIRAFVRRTMSASELNLRRFVRFVRSFVR